ncbi:cell division protein ZipA C-terminal FtsZ-binding domain-containing protein [Candidatus Methylomicrobium oryzae]|uniref:cell division protein ZipA C-terminal FtsZ-binding domain-containing protein n=1 Tax=Candidatus Methylomicrobium oryzae TaxID=2802053 RepID=UPI0019245840|nr:cell division protein ZipA C-terminal FtsZ-binding domain-containing protein [Methylomicrobium sp. RS1]MBL1263767.1 cell division protein ZipA C-terminal FtsZ-binding domain-containing protein [Methylomicrobium sp. RS1]
MDKELLRIVIIATGLIIITGMLAWAFVKSKKYRESLEEDFEDETPPKSGLASRTAMDDEDFLGTLEEDGDDRMAVAPVAVSAGKTSRYHEPEVEEPAAELNPEDEDYEDYEEPEPRFPAPSIIQFSVIANQDEGFNGLDLAHAFDIAGLEYGNLKIYERLDSKRLVDFGVASMQPPGTFPEHDLENFYCPGIIFFMQPGELEDAVPVFDDFVQTAVFMAAELDGTVLDHEHKPLSEKTVELIRRSL